MRNSALRKGRPLLHQMIKYQTQIHNGQITANPVNVEFCLIHRVHAGFQFQQRLAVA